jgi:low affinity Fe/Cu permease
MKRAFADIATTIDQLSGRPLTFGVALLIIAAWALSGPLFNFSDTWQLIINTSTTIITFLMVFVIQKTYYRDPHGFSLEEARLANSIAQQLAIGIDRHNAQKELQESEARFRLMAESAPVMIWMSGADGRCQHLNAMLRAFCVG